MKIMIVDDLPANRDYLKNLLGDSGHRLSEAGCDRRMMWARHLKSSDVRNLPVQKGRKR
jgi:CheY-like chemotaxis protein